VEVAMEICVLAECYHHCFCDFQLRAANRLISFTIPVFLKNSVRFKNLYARAMRDRQFFSALCDLRSLRFYDGNGDGRAAKVKVRFFVKKHNLSRHNIPNIPKVVAAFSTTPTKEQIDGLSKLQATEFLWPLNLSVNKTKLTMRQVLYNYI
jgi:hypothetical protein